MSSSCYQFWGDVLLFRVGIFWVWPLPSNSHHQHCYIFSNKSLPKPSFPTIASWEGVPHTRRYVRFLRSSLASHFVSPLWQEASLSPTSPVAGTSNLCRWPPHRNPWRGLKQPDSTKFTALDNTWSGIRNSSRAQTFKAWALGTLKTVTSLATQNANWIEDDMMLYIGPKPQNTGENDEV